VGGELCAPGWRRGPESGVSPTAFLRSPKGHFCVG
jgi:hypothetical protein